MRSFVESNSGFLSGQDKRTYNTHKEFEGLAKRQEVEIQLVVQLPLSSVGSYLEGILVGAYQ
jgi:hypothetical protein